jgi:hypothetical protein
MCLKMCSSLNRTKVLHHEFQPYNSIAILRKYTTRNKCAMEKKGHDDVFLRHRKVRTPH